MQEWSEHVNVHVVWHMLAGKYLKTNMHVHIFIKYMVTDVGEAGKSYFLANLLNAYIPAAPGLRVLMFGLRLLVSSLGAKTMQFGFRCA